MFIARVLVEDSLNDHQFVVGRGYIKAVHRCLTTDGCQGAVAQKNVGYRAA
jgi:hypothetical protein